jgi:hypothetical protein
VLLEAVLIVGSILLAFAIDAGWNSRIERLESEGTLLSLRADFVATAEEAARVATTHRLRVDRFTRFAELDLNEIRSIPEDSIAHYQIGFLNPRSLDPVMGTLDAMIGAGRLGLVGDEGLRSDLTSFRNQVEDSREELAWLQGTSLELWREFAAMGGPWKGPGALGEASVHLTRATHSDLERIYADPALMGLIRLNLEFAISYAFAVERLEALAVRIVQRIDQIIPAT